MQVIEATSPPKKPVRDLAESCGLESCPASASPSLRSNLPLIIRTIVFVGSCYKALYGNDREPTPTQKKRCLVAESMCLCFGGKPLFFLNLVSPERWAREDAFRFQGGNESTVLGGYLKTQIMTIPITPIYHYLRLPTCLLLKKRTYKKCNFGASLAVIVQQCIVQVRNSEHDRPADRKPQKERKTRQIILHPCSHFRSEMYQRR